MQVFYGLFGYILLLDIHLSIGKGCDLINKFNPVKFLCLSRAWTWISNVVCFVDIGGIVDHHCLNFLFRIQYCLFTYMSHYSIASHLHCNHVIRSNSYHSPPSPLFSPMILKPIQKYY